VSSVEIEQSIAIEKYPFDVTLNIFCITTNLFVQIHKAKVGSVFICNIARQAKAAGWNRTIKFTVAGWFFTTESYRGVNLAINTSNSLSITILQNLFDYVKSKIFTFIKVAIRFATKHISTSNCYLVKPLLVCADVVHLSVCACKLSSRS